MSTKLYKVHRRPRDSIVSDDEFELDEPEQKYNANSKENDENQIDIFLWPEYHLGAHYLGCLGQQSYSYALPKDFIVAYNYNEMDKDWFFWILKMNKLSPHQFLWIQKTLRPTVVDVNEDETFLKQIAMVIEFKLLSDPTLQVRLKPFMMFPETESYFDKIKAYIPDDNDKINKDNVISCIASQEWAATFGNKGCIHRHFDNLDKPSAFEKCGVFDADADECKLGLREQKGYVCKSKKEILAAYDKLTQELGRNDVVLKDCYGVSGDDITFWSSRKEIEDKFVWKESFKMVNIEENLKLGDGVNELDKVDFIGRSFYDNKNIGCGCDNIIVDGSSYAGSKTYTDKVIDAKLEKITEKVMKKIGTKFMGGFDFCVQTFKDKSIEPKIYLVDMNTARYTGVTQTLIVAEKFEIPMNERYFIRKTMHIRKDASFKRIMDEAGHILFNLKDKRGAYFHMFGPSGNDAIVSIFGKDEQDANDMLQQLQNMEFLVQ